MNDTMSIYLNIDDMPKKEREDLIDRMDQFLLPIGMKYSGFRNMYLPVDEKKRDDTVYNALEALSHCEWLKGIYHTALVGNMKYTGELDDLNTSMMAVPSPAKMACYEEYYDRYKKMAHGILIDENHCIVDGYTTFLIAQKYQLKNSILSDINIDQIVSSVPHAKVVIGRHVYLDKGRLRPRTSKQYCWIYPLREPVVPGDVLRVRTKQGEQYMVVDRISYIAGKQSCEKYAEVIGRTGCKLEESR